MVKELILCIDLSVFVLCNIVFLVALLSLDSFNRRFHVTTLKVKPLQEIHVWPEPEFCPYEHRVFAAQIDFCFLFSLFSMLLDYEHLSVRLVLLLCSDHRENALRHLRKHGFFHRRNENWCSFFPSFLSSCSLTSFILTPRGYSLTGPLLFGSFFIALLSINHIMPGGLIFPREIAVNGSLSFASWSVLITFQFMGTQKQEG